MASTSMGTELSSCLFPLRAFFHSCFLSFPIFGVCTSPRFFFTWYRLCSLWAASCHWRIICGQHSRFVQACASLKGSPSLKRGTNPLVSSSLPDNMTRQLNCMMNLSRSPSVILRFWSWLLASSHSDVSVKVSLKVSLNEVQWYSFVSSIGFSLLSSRSSIKSIMAFAQSWTCLPLMKVRVRATQLAATLIVSFFLFKNLYALKSFRNCFAAFLSPLNLAGGLPFRLPLLVLVRSSSSSSGSSPTIAKFTWVVGFGKTAGVKYWRGSSSSISWLVVRIVAIPWVMVSRSVGIGEASAVWRIIGFSDGVSSSDIGSGSFLHRYMFGVFPPFLFSPYFPLAILEPIVAYGMFFT